MMTAWRWPAALILALAAHVALLAQAPPQDAGSAPAQGEGGVTIALAPVGGSPDAADESRTAPEQETAEPEHQPEPKPEPEPEPASEPQPDPEREPKSEPEPQQQPPPEKETTDEAERQEPVSLPQQQAGNQARSGGGQAASTSNGRAGGGNPGARRDYLVRLQARLQRNKEYPPHARRRRVEGTVRLHFVGHADGRVSEARIVEGSGSRALDDAARAMLRRAEPLSPFPDDLGRESLTVPVAFRLR